jgi:hypothetical protein
MREQAPPTKRKFRSAWDQIDYLYHKLLYWFYHRSDRRHARRFASRLTRLVARADPHHETILGMSCRALIAELAGDLRKAIQYREQEIRFIEQVLRPGSPPLPDMGFDDVSDRMDLLAILHWNAGDPARAAEILEQSKRYCANHHLRFDGQDLLDEVRDELKAAPHNGRRLRPGASARTGS